ncbi:MAG: ATP-binding protein [Veillonella sp.]|uniref:ATP-binding protein n=1 Tax=Veillonella sp. TaxID=1926307 RepID=UPI0029019104|nr:ATP-binding protein [Veillonella sp.]MDU2902859.1 ATP-binding protein [Veillonella sp.]MDU2965064.1 ATP-binding protein [Veillonella sp.]
MPLIQREQYLAFLRRHKDQDVIKVVSGVRRCGKSTLFELFKQELLASGVKANQIISINFEDLEYEPLQEYHALHEYIVERLIPDIPMYVFLDEVQHVVQFEKVVGSLFVKPNVDIYITGSNAYFMSSDIATLLTGRYVQVEMLPLSFKEFHSAYSQQNLSDMDIYNLYIEHSSFPRLVHVEDDESIDEYLESILNTVVLKDIVTRLKITDVPLLLDIIKYLLANIGSLINPTKIANTLTSYGRKTDNKTVEKYLQGFKDGLLIYEVDRFDVKGKALLQRNAKYYVVDSAFRKFLLSRTDSDRGHILENIVYLELIRRGYRVYVGHLQNGEIDFVAKKPHRLEYYQVSYSVMEDTTLRRELSPLEKLDDNYPKYLLTMDVLHKTDNHNGIEQKNVLDWLLE